MQLSRLIYVSAMTPDCDTKALLDILRQSRLNNEANDITGVLCYDPAYFFQCVEGPREAVDKLFNALKRDSRHKRITVLAHTDVEERHFGEWSMGFLPGSAVDKDLMRKYSSSKGRFDPFTLNADQAFEFLVDLVERKREQIAH